MQHLARFFLTLCFALLIAQSATAADYVFTLYNNTTKYTIAGFQTYENETWTSWKNVALAPGEKQQMNWGANTISHIHLHRPLFRGPAANRLFSAYLSVLLAVPQRW